MYVEKGEKFLPEISLESLEAAYNTEKNAKAKTRLLCAILRKKGRSEPFIAEVTGKPTSTVSDILKRFIRRGLDGCYAIKQIGQPKRLTEKQRKQLKQILTKSPEKQGLPFVIWTTKLIQYFIKKRFGVSYVIMQVHRILKKLGLTMQKARPEHLKANKMLQAEFKKKIDDKLVSLDTMDMRSYFWTNVHSVSHRTS